MRSSSISEVVVQGTKLKSGIVDFFDKESATKCLL